jgi:hypothetical protein
MNKTKLACLFVIGTCCACSALAMEGKKVPKAKSLPDMHFMKQSKNMVHLKVQSHELPKGGVPCGKKSLLRVAMGEEENITPFMNQKQVLVAIIMLLKQEKVCINTKNGFEITSKLAQQLALVSGQKQDQKKVIN